MQFESIKDIWDAVCDNCTNQKTITPVARGLWLDDIVPMELKDGKFTASIYSDWKQGLVLSNFKSIIEESFLQVIGIPVTFELLLSDEDGSVITKTETASAGEESYESHFTFENFIVGSSNRFAHATSMAVADNPSNIYNPLVIYGASGVGKTHLLFAIKNKISKKFPEKKIEYIRGEEFTNMLITAIQDGKIGLDTIHDFRNRFRTTDVLLMDDIHFIAGKESTMEEFYNTFDALSQANKQIVVTCDRPINEIKTLTDRIRTRLSSGVMADMSPPDFETRVGIIKTKASLLDLNLEDNIVFFIAEHVKMNTRQIEGVIKKIHAHVTLQNKSLTVSVVQNLIRDIMNDNTPEPVKIEEIVSEVSKTFSVSEKDIISKRKTAQVAFARQVAMYIARETTELSYKAIGDSFGKDHTTVLHNVQKIENHLSSNPFDKELVEDIIKNLMNT